MKEELKRDLNCTIIEEVTISIESNMKYVCSYQLIDVTAFYFVGDIIFEAANCRLKRVDVTVSKIMSIDASALTLIGKTQTRKNHKYIMCKLF